MHILSSPIANAVVHSGLVYVSGMVGFQPGTTELISDDFRVQGRSISASRGTLVECNSSIGNILTIRVFLANIRRDFIAFNEEFLRRVGHHRPARTTVEVKLAVEGLLIEADCIGATQQG